VRTLLSGTLCFVAVLLGSAAQADAGGYRVAQCHPDFDVGPADVDFRRTSEHYRAESACGAGSGGLAVTHEATHTKSGRWGAWTATAPPGAELVRATAVISGKKAGGHVPQFLVGPMSQLVPFGTAAGGFHRISWDGSGAERVRAALSCSRSTCGPGADARVRMRRLMLGLLDSRPPRLTAAGSLFAPASRRGLHGITASATDTGSGVHRVFVAVNGEPVVAETLDCALDGTVAIRMRPCPAHAEPGFAASTADPPFRQGPNHVRVCATDYAPHTGGSRDCVARQVRVDNACPLSNVGAGSRLRFHVRKSGRGPIHHGDGALLMGRLLDSASRGVAGAEICAAARTELRGVPEQIVATPTTDQSGRFSVRMPAGPNRRLRVAYWPTAATVVERSRSLRVRARPRLKLLPGGVLRNGDRVRFRVNLPGPRAAKRQIALKVRANGRWLPLRRGGTNRHGVWTGSYRFRATTGQQTYRFRAFVPKQRGYPYVAGRSKTKRQTVVG